MLTQPKAGGLLGAGVTLLLIAFAGQFASQALLGQQQSETLANLPTALVGAVGFLFSTAHLLGAALIAAYLAIRVISPAARRTETATELAE